VSFPYALELVDVVKRFGDHTAVDNVSFTVETGTIMALLGPNGAGKTTTIEMCEGFQRPDSGKISVLGMSPATEPDKVRAQVGIMLQDSGSYSGIRVREMLELTASYSRDPLKPDWLLELFGLQNVQRTTYRRLSGGQKQRLNLAVALISRPRLVFVDEPTAGMDAQSRLLVWDLLRALRSDGVTVILTTHLMDEAQALADRVTIVDRGRVVAQGTPAELQAATATTIHFETDGDVDLSRGEWQKLGVSATKPRTYVLHTTPRPEVVAKLAQQAAHDVEIVAAHRRYRQHLDPAEAVLLEQGSDVVEQAALCLHRGLDPVEHPVDGSGQSGEVVSAPDRHPSGQVVLTDGLGGAPQLLDGAQEPLDGEPGQTCHQGYGEHGRRRVEGHGAQQLGLGDLEVDDMHERPVLGAALDRDDENPVVR